MMQLPPGAGAPPGLPPGLAALIQHPPTDPDEKGPYPNDGGLSCLQDTIGDTVRLIHELTDPQDVQDATQALQIFTRVQTRLMGKSGASGGPAAGR